MSKVSILNQLPEAYNRVRLEKVLTDIQFQLNGISEGGITASYNALTAAPTTGTYTIGDFIRNSDATNGIFGWLCTADGTPGTWQTIVTNESLRIDGAFTPTANSFTVVGTPTYTATYKRIGNVVHLWITAVATVSIACTGGTSNFTGFPSAIQTTNNSACIAVNNSAVAYGVGLLNTANNGSVFPPSWAATSSIVQIYTTFYI